MQHDGQTGFNHSSFHQLLQVGAVGISACALGYLQNQGRFQVRGGFGNALNDFHIVDIECADGITAVIGFFKHFLRSNQRHNDISFYD